MIRSALALAIAGCSNTVPQSMGGLWSDFEAKAVAQMFSTEQPRIAGTCASACTAWLLAACVEPSAKLGFHAQTIGGQPIRDPEQFQIAINRMAAAYPPEMAIWFRSWVTPESREVVWLRGDEVIAMGAPRCN